MFSRLRRMGPAVIAAFILMPALAVPVLMELRPDNTISAFLPDGDERAERTAAVIVRSPLANLIHVDIECRDASGLHGAAERILAAVPADLLRPLDLSMKGTGPGDLLALYPSLFDEKREAELSTLLTDDAPIRRALGRSLALLQTPAAAAAFPWIRTDPLGLREAVLAHLPGNPPAGGPASPSPALVSEDGKRALLLFRPVKEPVDAASAERMAEALEKASADADGAVIRCSGGPLHTAANARAVRHDVRTILTVSLAGFALVYLFLVGSWGALWILAAPAAATVLAAAGTAAAYPGLSGLALGFGASLMGLSEDYAVHVHFALRSCPDMGRAHSLLRRPLFQSWMLNCTGFAVLLFSAVPAVRQLALFSLLSLTAGYLFALLVLPVLPWAGRPSLPSPPRPSRPRTASAATALTLLILLSAPLLLMAPGLSADLSPSRLGSGARELAQNAEHIRKAWGEHAGAMAVYTAQGPDAKEESLSLARAAAARLREAGTPCLSPSDMIPPAGDTAANLARWARWTAENGPALQKALAAAGKKAGFGAEAFAPFYGFLAAPALPADRVLLETPAFRDAASLLLFPSAGGWCAAVRTLPRMDAEGSAAAAAEPPAEAPGDAVLLGTGREEQEIEALFRNESRLIAPAALLCILLLALFTGSVRRFLTVCIPPLAAVCAALAAHFLPGLPLTLMSLLSMPIIFGLALDHGIMTSHALETGEGLGITRAVVISSLTAFIGMGILAFAEHPALRSMGLTITAGLAAELAAALLLVPLCYGKPGPEPGVGGQPGSELKDGIRSVPESVAGGQSGPKLGVASQPATKPGAGGQPGTDRKDGGRPAPVEEQA